MKYRRELGGHLCAHIGRLDVITFSLDNAIMVVVILTVATGLGQNVIQKLPRFPS